MTHSRLKGDYQMLVQFVRASGVNTCKHQKIKSSSNHEVLDGQKVRTFYENVISSKHQSSTSELPLKTHRKKHLLKEGNLEKQLNKSCKKKPGEDKIRKTTSRRDRSSCSSAGGRTESIAESKTLTTYDAVTEYKDAQETNQGCEDTCETARRLGLQLLKHAQEGDEEQIKMCLQNGVPVDFQDQFGWTALMCASVSGNSDTVQFLLDQRADVSVKDTHGKTAKDLARQSEQECIVQIFEQADSPQTNNNACVSSSNSSEHMNVCNTFFCTVCKREFFDTNQKQHQSSTVHLFNMQLKPKSDHYLIPESNVGYRMMLKGGWNADKGLGPDGSGNMFPVKTILKRDRKGLGAEQKVTAKITHFNPHDKTATQNLKKATERKVSVRTLSKRAMLLKEKRDKSWEIQLRRYMNSD